MESVVQDFLQPTFYFAMASLREFYLQIFLNSRWDSNTHVDVGMHVIILVNWKTSATVTEIRKR